jgi:beta-aspartyl-dipeptidase (metallo-type)
MAHVPTRNDEGARVFSVASPPAEDMMLTLVTGGRVFAPEPLGEKDILVAGGTVAAIAEPGAITVGGVPVTTIDAAGAVVIPGLIDPHVHLIGGGGEGGPATRAPEIRVEDIAAHGVTTVIGCLGTDGITRHMTSLLAKARALETEGISTWIFSGSYELPVVTLTGSIRGDLVVVDKVLGAGEIAVSDHRSAQPTFAEVARLAAECRVGGMLGGKPGILHLHLGDGPRGLEYVRRLAEETEIPRTQVVPTHCNRNPRLLDEAVELAAAGGCVDLTAGLDRHGAGIAVVAAVRLLQERGAPLHRVTVSSDANGSIPVFDAAGELTGLGVATQDDLLDSFRSVVREGVLDLTAACRLFSGNAAAIYRLAGKGRIAAGCDADLVVLDADLNPREVLARGRRLVAGGEVIVRGTFSTPAEARHG